MNNNQPDSKKAMVLRYPLQIWAAARKFGALTCAASLSSPDETDEKNSPLEMHSGFSVFRLAIASSGGGSVTANIPARDVPAILEDYRFQRDYFSRYLLQRPTSAAYTVPIPDRACNNKTPAEVLQSPDGLQKLQSAKSFLERNLSRYPKNRAVINAIDEAITLFQEHKLRNSSMTNILPLYHTDFKHYKKQYDKGYKIYFVDISGSVSDELSWTFTITNCFAPLKNTIEPDMSKATDKKSLNFKITKEEMDLFIHRLRSTMERYEAMMFRTQYSIAKKYAWDNTPQSQT